MSFFEQSGLYFGSLGVGINENPYDLKLGQEDLTTRMLYATADPRTFAYEFGMVPFKASMMWNAMKMGWGASRALGITSSLKDPFNPKNALWRYRAKTLRGLVGDTTQLAGDTTTMRLFGAGEVAEGRPTFARILDSYRKGKPMQAWEARGFKDPAFHDKVRHYRTVEDKIMAASKADAPRAGSVGMLHRQILKPHAIMDMLHQVDPDLHDYVRSTGGGDKLAKKIIGRMQKYREGGSWSDRLLKAGVKDYEAVQEGSRLSFLRSTKEFIGDAVKLNFDRTKINMQALLNEDPKLRKKLVLKHSSSKRDAKMFKNLYKAQREAFYQLGREQIQSNIDDMIKEGMEKQYSVPKIRREAMRELGAKMRAPETIAKMEASSLDMVQRLKRMRTAKLFIGGGLGIALGTAAVKGTLRLGMEVPARLAATLKDITRMEFGSGDMVMSSRLASERQRAVQAIQNAQLNARYLMGNEASLYH